MNIENHLVTVVTRKLLMVGKGEVQKMYVAVEYMDRH